MQSRWPINVFSFLAWPTQGSQQSSPTSALRCLQGAADKVVSDAVSMAMLLGTALGVAMYAAAPWLLARIAGPASAAVVAPALVYVRIRCAELSLFSPRERSQDDRLHDLMIDL